MAVVQNESLALSGIKSPTCFLNKDLEPSARTSRSQVLLGVSEAGVDQNVMIAVESILVLVPDCDAIKSPDCFSGVVTVVTFLRSAESSDQCRL